LSRGALHRRLSAAPPSLAAEIRELLGARELLALLFARELRVRYKQTALGVLWVVLQPLVPAVIFAVVLGTFARLPSAGIPYLLFALSGLVLYSLFSGIVTRAAGSLVRDSQLVTRVYFPRAVLPLATGSAAIVDFMVGLGVLLAIMVGMGLGPTVEILVLPGIVALTACLAFAFGLALSALTAHYRDFSHAVPFVLQVLLYASPVVYSLELLPSSTAGIYAFNPLVPLIEAFRWALLGTPAPEPSHVLAGSVTGLVIVGLAMLVFSRASRDVADVI
jgi:lipopolysaccharide transport system permease protein